MIISQYHKSLHVTDVAVCWISAESAVVCVSTVAGQEDCWLLTETLVQSVSLQLKVCLNIQCLALHSFTDLHPGKAQGLITVCTPK